VAGFGRRNFVQLLGAAASSIVTARASALSLDRERYENLMLGLSFRKPADWFYASFTEYLSNGSELTNAAEVAEFRESMGRPLVTIIKYRETPPMVTPSIVVFAEAPEWNATERDLFDLDVSVLTAPYENVVIEEELIEDEVAGHVASRTVCSYDSKSEAGETARMRTQLYAFLRHGLMYSFNFSDVLDARYSAPAELLSARDSIAFSRVAEGPL
jgi:hypothetical protein